MTPIVDPDVTQINGQTNMTYYIDPYGTHIDQKWKEKTSGILHSGKCYHKTNPCWLFIALGLPLESLLYGVAGRTKPGPGEVGEAANDTLTVRRDWRRSFVGKTFSELLRRRPKQSHHNSQVILDQWTLASQT